MQTIEEKPVKFDYSKMKIHIWQKKPIDNSKIQTIDEEHLLQCLSLKEFISGIYKWIL